MMLQIQIVFVVAAAAAVVLGQRTIITSESGRNTYCINEANTLSYTCSGEGNTLFVIAPSYIDEFFVASDRAPIARTSSNAILTLLAGSPNYSARLELFNVTSDVTITCRTNVDDSSSNVTLERSDILPQPPSNVEVGGLTGDTKSRDVTVTWRSPSNTSFILQGFMVNILLDENLMSSSMVVGTSCVATVPFNLGGVITATVATVSTCNDVGPAMHSTSSVQATYPDFYAAFLVPLLIILILLIIIVVLVIVLLLREKNAKSKQVRDRESLGMISKETA